MAYNPWDDLGNFFGGRKGAWDFFNDVTTDGKFSDADSAEQAALEALQNIKAPTREDLSAHYGTNEYLGDVAAQNVNAAQQGANAFDGVSVDPRLQDAQMQALSGLQDVYSNGGLTAQDRARLAQISEQEATQQRGAREAILQNARQRGVAGSGLEMLSQMQNQQAAAGRQNARDLGVEAMAQQRALDAMMQAGQLGGQMRGQSFNEQAQKAQAQNAINQFNAQNSQQANVMNAQLGQQASMRNADTRQNVSNANTGIKNAQALQNAGANQQAFSNQMGVVGAQTQQRNRQADIARDEAKHRQNAVVEAGKSVMQMLPMAFSDKNLKTDVEEFDAGAFLDQLVPSKYKYKSERHGEGEQVGVMAQDLEKGAPQMVIDTPEGKVVDYNKAGGPLFASLADINKRLRKVEGEE